MLEFCPLCMKNGRKERVRLFQLNLNDAVWACGASDCIWPIGYEDLTFFQTVSAVSKNDRGETSSSTRDVLSNMGVNNHPAEIFNNLALLTSTKQTLERMLGTETISAEVHVPSYKEMVVSKENVSTNIEETNFSKENILIPMELSLYTPPVTPAGGELIKEGNMSILSPESVSTPTENRLDQVPYLTEDKPEVSEDESNSSVKQSKRSSNHLSISELSEVVNNNAGKRNKLVGKEDSERTDKALPKITNIEKTNIDLKIEHYNKTAQYGTKQQECTDQPFINTLVTEIAKEYNVLIDDYKLWNKIDLDEQWKKKKPDNNQMTHSLQSSNNTEIVTEINSCTEMPRVEINTCGNFDMSNCSTLNSSSGDLNFEEMLGDIAFSDDNMENMFDTEWLSKLLES